MYDVEIASGTKVFDAKVDANKGWMISSAEDKVDPMTITTSNTDNRTVLSARL
ncbi:hypothetical protein [Paraburkholderia terricola]|uniref:hypothetical protein n=1 Tax=Paraburkholderia terricola TaxID=169427 RepID=UPI001FCA1107|nr:hypothetical protein [Paraburkholderia terricola]